MKKVKGLSSLLLVLMIMMMVSACGTTSGTTTETSDSSTGEAAEGEKIVLNLSIPEPEGAKYDIGAKAFKEELERLTDGQLSVKIYYNNTFGGEREAFEMMGTGSLDMALQSAGPMGIWVKEMNMFDLPFLFDNLDHAHAVLDSEIGDELAAKFEEVANVKVLGWMENGFVQVTNSKLPINDVSDVEGLKIRVQENEVQLDTWRAYGADPTPMAWPEVFTGLQQKVIDGQSNGFPTLVSAKFYEVQDYVTRLEDRYAPGPLAISKQVFDSLSPEHQEAIMKAAEYAVPIGRQANKDKEEEAISILEEKGMKINVPDKESFKAKVEPVYEKWAPQIGQELIDRVRNFEY